MKKQKGEGAKVREYLKENKVSQTDLAAKMGMTRQGLVWHLGQEKLSHEFKMKLRENGVEVFDKEGKLNLSFSGEHSTNMQVLPRTTEELLALHRKHEATQDKLIEQQGRELDTAYKYIKNLEDKLGLSG